MISHLATLVNRLPVRILDYKCNYTSTTLQLHRAELSVILFIGLYITLRSSPI